MAHHMVHARANEPTGVHDLFKPGAWKNRIPKDKESKAKAADASSCSDDSDGACDDTTCLRVREIRQRRQQP